ncbi:la-related protein 6C-like [Tasmannia lanceolata]|uniref:la-related protein 6C-like n=1 Tax=Tasmannia lanceolata TaxID=3420 RepID=UPI0040646395
MAQAYPGEKPQEHTETEMKSTVSFKFNAQAPEFVPRSQTQMPVSGYFYPCFHFIGGSGSSDWLYVGDQEPVQLIANSSVQNPNSSKNFLTDDLRHKIIKQVEYQFSTTSLTASDTLMKLINKDPEGYVPISFIASSKKIKSLVSNHHMLATALRGSSKLVVSDDGKKVKSKHVFTDRDKEELQSRIVVVENLPEDHSHQNIEKMFSVVGSVKNVRICHPQESNASRSSKADVLISNKLHALVEYETVEKAEKAVEKLNDEKNWREGLRVRLLLRRSPRSVVRSRKSEYDHFEGNSEDEEVHPSESLEESSQSTEQQPVENNAEDNNSSAAKKGWNRGRGKARGRAQSHNGRGLLAAAPQPSSLIQCEALSKPTPRGPRMPDGTRGFTMGRGMPMPTVLVVSPLD